MLKTVTINNIKIRYDENQKNPNGSTFELYKNGKPHGCKAVSAENRELGFNSGVYASDDELNAINEVRLMLGQNAR